MSTLDKLHYALNLNKTKRQQIITKALKSNDYKSIKKELTSKFKNTNSSRVKADIDFVNSYKKIVKGGAIITENYTEKMKNAKFIWKISSILIEAIKAGKIQEVNINFQDKNGDTALMWDSMSNGSNNSKDNIKLLLDNGADPNIQNVLGYTALMFASSHNNEVVELLLDKGAEINLKNKSGWTALMHAVDRDKYEIVKLLLDKGADINIQNNDGETALMIAAYIGDSRGDSNARMKIVHLLLDNGTNINIKNKDGKDVLQFLDEKIKESYSIRSLKIPGKYSQWYIKIQKIIKDYKNTQNRPVNNSIFTSNHKEIGYINPLHNLQIQ
jgi:ankyrin repeat protein